MIGGSRPTTVTLAEGTLGGDGPSVRPGAELARGRGARRGADESGCTPGFVPRVLADVAVTAIHLGPALPPASCGLPADSGEQPSNVRAGAPRCSLLTLLRVGFT